MIEAPTIARLVQARAAATPDALMLIDEHDRTMTFRQYADAVDDMARSLAALGVAPGDTVAWQLPTRFETVVLLGALSRLDAVQVPILPIHREREIRFAMSQTGAELLCVPGTWRGVDYVDIATNVRDDLGGSFEIVVYDPWPRTGAAAPDATLPPLAERDDVVRYVYFTSGTTSDPKGAQHVERAAVLAGRALVTSQGFRPTDRYGVAFPFTHIGGLTNVSAVLAGGHALILLETFSAPHAVEVFRRHHATIVGGGTAFYLAFLDEQRKSPDEPILPELRFMTGGAAPMPPSVHFEVRDEIGGRGCCHGYGMTETCSMAAMNHPDDTDEHLAHTVGRLCDGMVARVVTATGEPAAPGEDGELRLKSDWMLVGYLDPRLDADAFDEDGWFRTGDLASIDAEGYLRITGRIKDIIIRKGENLSAKELEDLLFEHPAVADAAVIGLPDPESGEMVCAVLLMKPGQPALTLDQIRDHFLAAEVMRQKIPERLEIVESMPRNASGKITKKDLVERYAAPG